MDSKLSGKKVLEISKMVKMLADAMADTIKEYTAENVGSEILSDADTPLYAMQVLSLLCGSNRGYSMLKMAEIWSMSMDVSDKLNSYKRDTVEDNRVQTYAYSDIKN